MALLDKVELFVMHYRHSRKGNNMIKINHLTITQNKDLRDLVSDLNMTIQDGEKVAIIGEEGNGKSTLLRALMGEALPDLLSGSHTV